VNNKKAAAFRQGIYVVIALAVLTAIEFWVSITLNGPAVPLFLIALIKAALVVYYFMHIYRLWREERHE
jgi:cytochrome c oxidase subunit 4